jgi:hypothetical protein
MKEEGRRKKEEGSLYNIWGIWGLEPQLKTGHPENGRGIKPAARIMQMSNNIGGWLG